MDPAQVQRRPWCGLSVLFRALLGKLGGRHFLRTRVLRGHIRVRNLRPQDFELLFEEGVGDQVRLSRILTRVESGEEALPRFLLSALLMQELKEQSQPEFDPVNAITPGA
jgi:hypothetical protein